MTTVQRYRAVTCWAAVAIGGMFLAGATETLPSTDPLGAVLAAAVVLVGGLMAGWRAAGRAD